MYRYAAKRSVLSVVTVFLVSVMTFVLTHVLPGSAARMVLGMQATPERVEAVRQELGLNRPLWVQYFDWITGFLTGDLGNSFLYDTPVSELLVDRLPPSLLLAATAVTIAVLTAIPLGIIASRHQNQPVDVAISTFTFAGISVPNFFWGIVFILVFAKWMNLLPPSGYAAPWDAPMQFLTFIVMPAAALGWSLLAYITRMTRSSMLETYRENYITTARAKGVSEEGIVYRHALRNAMLPTLTVIAFQVGYAFGGIIIIEQIFSWPGIGSLLFSAILERDLPVIQAAVIAITVVFVGSNFIVDMLYAFLDPRIRYGGEGS
ncbi:MAG: ABC transporter permease [Halolamina sp.]